MATLIETPVTVPSSDESPVKVVPGDPWPLPYRGSKYSVSKQGNGLKMSWNRMDPFAGSNTTGYAAETLGRRWLSIEANETYIRGSIGRFGRRNVILKRKRKSSDII